MLRYSGGNYDKLLEKATSHLLMEPDWPSILQICDLIRQNDVQPKHALNALKKKLNSQNPHSALYALLVLESMVKNCGSVVHEELTTKAYCDALHDLAKTTPHENVRSKLLELIQVWTFAFRKNPKHSSLKETMIAMKAEGYKFPVLQESDAMFSADTAPEWLDGSVCHRCRVAFSLLQRKHHCRACGQVFCGQCTSKTTTLPKYGIEKEVRVCDACFDAATKPTAASKAAQQKTESELPPEYLKSPLAQQNQDPPKKSEEELREEEEFQLALALSQSEAEAKEKAKFKATATMHGSKKSYENEANEKKRNLSPHRDEPSNPELARYLDRSYWETLQNDSTDRVLPSSPSAPSAVSTVQNLEARHDKSKENGLADANLDEFISSLRSQVEIFINRMKSNSSRGRSIANDSSVQSLFLNITAMHSQLFHHIQDHDDRRLYYERLQDKQSQVKDARAALDALREEHRDKLRREAEEAERMRQMQMARKLEIMRKKKQEYLQYQRQLALQRIQEQEREMQMRQEQQKQQYIVPQQQQQQQQAQYSPYVSVQQNQQPVQQFVPPHGYVYQPPMMGPPPGFPQQFVPQQYGPLQAPLGLQQPQGSHVGLQGPQGSHVGLQQPQGSHVGLQGPQGSHVGLQGPQGSHVGLQQPQGSHVGLQQQQGPRVGLQHPPPQQPEQRDGKDQQPQTAELIKFD